MNGRPTWTGSDGCCSAAVGLQLHFGTGGCPQGKRNPDARAVNRVNAAGTTQPGQRVQAAALAPHLAAPPGLQ